MRSPPKMWSPSITTMLTYSHSVVKTETYFSPQYTLKLAKCLQIVLVSSTSYTYVVYDWWLFIVIAFSLSLLFCLLFQGNYAALWRLRRIRGNLVYSLINPQCLFKSNVKNI